jgi:2-succinyl-6-hydroxy-2,4-cyclohexadiene-1-carboxylate synthase
MPFITIDQTRYHYIEAGAGQPMLLLHGFTGCAENWAEVMHLLVQRFRVIALDLPGHGLTQAPDDVTQFSLTLVSQQIAVFIHLIIGTPVHLLGYSMGGRLALHVALELPAQVKTLTLESASPGLQTMAEQAARIASDEALAERIERDGIAAFVAEWERLPLWVSQQKVSEEKRARLHAQRLQNNPRGLALSLRGMGAGAHPSLWHRLSELKVSTLLLAGAQDAKFVAIARRMAAAIPQSQLHIISDAGHSTHFEQPASFVAHIR